MDIEKTLKEIGVPAGARRVYSELLKLKKATARQLAENLSMSRPSVYDQLKILIKMGLALEFEEENKKHFRIDDPKNITQLLHDKIAVLRAEEKKLKEALPKLIGKSESVEPRIKFFSGQDGFRQALNDILWYENAEVLAMWPYGDMNDVVGEDYLKNFTKRRMALGIKVRSIWARGKDTYVSKIPFERTRVAPPGMNWHMGYIIYGEKVAFISSRYESFAFVVSSRDFSELKRAEFEQIWKNSKRAKLTPLETQGELK